MHFTSNDIVIVCNLYLLDKLPEWPCKLVLFLRNLTNVKEQDWINHKDKFEMIYYVCDEVSDFDKEFAEQLAIPYELRLSQCFGYPVGKYMSTGFAAVMEFPESLLIGFEHTETHNNTVFHEFVYEHNYINEYRTNILLK